MNKNYKIIELAVWGFIFLLCLSFLLVGLKSGPVFPVFRLDGINAPGTTELNNTKFDAGAVTKIAIDVESADVRFSHSATDSITVVTRGPSSEKGRNLFTVSEDNGVVNIVQNSNTSFFSWFGASESVEIGLPDDYAKDLSLSTSSGDISFNGNYTFHDADLARSSGDIVGGELTADEFSCRGNSGDMRLGELKTTRYNIEFTSGDVNIGGITGAGSIRGSSGNVVLTYATITGDSSISVNSGDVTARMASSAGVALSAQCNSGDIYSDFPLSYSGRDRNSASGNIGTDAKYKFDISTTSGDIHLSR